MCNGCTETVLVAEIAAAEGQTTALSALLHAAQAAWAERDALRDRQEMVLRREAERDEEELVQQVRAREAERIHQATLALRGLLQLGKEVKSLGSLRTHGLKLGKVGRHKADRRPGTHWDKV